MKKHKDGIEWGGPNQDWYWFYWWNWLPKDLRYFGYTQDWYDGPMSSFGLWFINLTWRLPWTRHNGKKTFLYWTKNKRVLAVDKPKE